MTASTIHTPPNGHGDERGAHEGEPRGPETTPLVADDESIVSVNQRTPASNNRVVKAIILVLGSALLLGMGMFAFQKWAGQAKDSIKESAKNTKANLGAQARSMLNPEGKAGSRESKLGAAGERLPTAAAAPASSNAGFGDGIRPLRGPDGQILINVAGKALGVDSRGQLVEVPAIEPIGGDRAAPVALNDETAKRAPSAASSAAGNAKKIPSRYGGALMADGSGLAGAGSATGTVAEEPSQRTSMATEVLKTLLAAKQGKPENASSPTFKTSLIPGAGEGEGAKAAGSGPVSSQLASSATPLARARQMPDQALLLPKGRQVDCVLTTRIVNELPGFTSCALTQNLYSANGKVLLLERGSEVTGEYGVSSQMGLRRLFIVWTRVRTPGGIEVDLQSPGADALGTSGVPGYLEQRWMERIGAALLISVMKDVFELEIARQRASNDSATVVLGPTPGQNTMQAGQDIGEQVVKQTLNVKPTLYINEGSRVSIYVARDLDFSPVYSLRTVASSGQQPAGLAR